MVGRWSLIEKKIPYNCFYMESIQDVYIHIYICDRNVNSNKYLQFIHCHKSGHSALSYLNVAIQDTEWWNAGPVCDVIRPYAQINTIQIHLNSLYLVQVPKKNRILFHFGWSERIIFVQIQANLLFLFEGQQSWKKKKRWGGRNNGSQAVSVFNQCLHKYRLPWSEWKNYRVLTFHLGWKTCDTLQNKKRLVCGCGGD